MSPFGAKNTNVFFAEHPLDGKDVPSFAILVYMIEKITSYHIKMQMTCKFSILCYNTFLQGIIFNTVFTYCIGGSYENNYRRQR